MPSVNITFTFEESRACLLVETDGRRAVASVFWFKIGHDPEPVPQTHFYSVFQ
jgi:anion-transporting  ArsA/GET3 family ATPase